MQEQLRILVCDDDEIVFKSLSKIFAAHQLVWAANCDLAIDYLDKNSVDLLLLDVSIRSDQEGLKYLPTFKKKYPDVATVMLSGNTDYQAVHSALTQGAIDYIVKDSDPKAMVLTLEKTINQQKWIKDSQRISAEVRRDQSRRTLVGESAAIREIQAKLDKLRHNQVNVLITGERGTGKEIVARQLRKLQTANGTPEPFVSVDSSTIHASTAEAVLFGYEKGAFTGADRLKKGLFEEADGGVIYFDEIGNMSLEIQAKLLRVIQEKEVLRLGSSRPIPLKFRVIAATNRDLHQDCKDGKFRSDLLERIAVIPLALPPLRERKQDIPLLTDYFLKLHGQRRQLSLTQETQNILVSYNWPGNVRELGNLIVYLEALATHDTIEAQDLPSQMLSHKVVASSESPNSTGSFYEQVKQFEQTLLANEYKKAGGKVTQLAKNLQMDRSHLYQKLKLYNIHSS